MKFEIFIPSKGRCEKQITLSKLPGELLNVTAIVVGEEDYDDYEFAHGNKVSIVSCPAEGISNVRQWVIDNCLSDYAFMLDDDMNFFKREELDTKLAKCGPEDLLDLFELLVRWLDHGIPSVGVSARQGNNHVLEEFRDATRQMNFHGVDVNFFKENNIRFDELPVMEDFAMVLSLLTLGYSNRVSYEYCWNQTGSGEAGGCSSYRNWELQKSAAESLSQLYPDFVTVVKKKTKSTWKEFPERYDVRVQWKKAFNSNLT